SQLHQQCIRKLGTCPVVIYQCTKTSPPHKCHRDRDCLGTLKCCPGACGKQCLRPHSGKELSSVWPWGSWGGGRGVGHIKEGEGGLNSTWPQREN
uniref:WAP domain-containing protein n=1 Tax=Vombatus ursinus TaxID=29139 RepID=A0A4X2JS49_VOMUR